MKRNKLKKYLFYAILILLPFNIRHIFNFEQIQNIEGFREHISWSIYGFDIVFILLLICSFKNIAKKNIWLICFLIILILSALFSQNYQIAFYNSLRILEAIIFSLIAKNLLEDKEIFNMSALIVFLSGIFQTILAIFQFILQKSIGLKFLGESIISPQILGVAKIEIHSEKFIRAYGTFPHPNLLGAFLLFSLVCGVYVFKNKRNFWLGIFAILVGIFLTFSRTIWLATFILTLTLIIQYTKYNIQNTFQSFFSRKFIIIAVMLLVPIFYVIIQFAPSRLCLANCTNDNSYDLRKTYNLAAIEIIKSQPLFGVGIGNFVPAMVGTRPAAAGVSLHAWEHQPAHNLYLLIASETGPFGLIIFLLFLYKLLKNQHNYLLFTIYFLLLLLLGLFDHYFWTLPQGQLIFWLSLAFLANSSRIKILDK